MSAGVWLSFDDMKRALGEVGKTMADGDDVGVTFDTGVVTLWYRPADGVWELVKKYEWTIAVDNFG